jgi:hypothetical protein
VYPDTGAELLPISTVANLMFVRSPGSVA